MFDRRLLVTVVLLLGLVALSVNWGCGNDDDDDDDDQIANVETLVERLVDQFDTDGENNAWVAYVVTQPLAADVAVTAAEGEVSHAPDNAFWFAYLDEDPLGQFEHATRFVFVDADSGALVAEQPRWWPELDGQALFLADYDLLKVYAPQAVPDEITQGGSTKAKADAPNADYGDAPDDTPAYLNGSIGGSYPTLYATANSATGDPGGHTLTVGQETLGPNVSAEVDADDPNDPDGTPNLIDDDADDKVYWVFYFDRNSGALTVRFLVEVAVAAGAPDQDRYINILVDTDRSGQWKHNSLGDEWLVQNFKVNVSPGSSRWIWTDPVAMPLSANNTFVFETWVRVALTRSQIDGTPFGSDGWDGSGAFKYGEIEDHYFNFVPWYGPGGGGDDDDDDIDDDDDVTPPTYPVPELPPVTPPEPEEKECVYVCQEDQIEIPYQCKALVINLGDSPGNSWMERNGQKAQSFFEGRFGSGNSTLLNKPTADEAADAISDFLEGGTCLDELWVYITGHGSTSGIRAQNGGGKLTSQKLRDAIDPDGHCQSPMDYYAGECSEEGYCNLNFMIQSCHSGHLVDGSSDAIDLPGVNVLTSASKNKVSYGRGDGDGSYVSNALWGAHENNQADDPPNGNDDGEVDPQEAMSWAKDNYKGNKSDPQTSLGGDCECVCTLPEWGWEDPEGDLIFWYGVPGSPTDTPGADVLTYGIKQTVEGFDAIITYADDLDTVSSYTEWAVAFDSDPSSPNGEPTSPQAGADEYYVIFSEAPGVFELLRVSFNGSSWAPVATSTTYEVDGDTLTLHIDPTEMGIVEDQDVPVHAVTYFLDGDPAGDDTTYHDFALPPLPSCCR
ncbi:MAG: hypothetical protein P9M14_06060 [Candidatus Alcyoniella australis]|nr:hypothetical protein [Candidatus Alcyoniella australis]